MEMLTRCSPETLFRRFHGPARAAELTRAQLQSERAIVYSAWTGRRCVGLGVLALDDAGTGHLGILVEDEWQRRSVGRGLTGAVVAHARSDGIDRLHADVLVEATFIVPMLRRLGAVSVSTSMGTHSVDISLTPGMPPDQMRRREETTCLRP